ncbi:hypothetical protein ABBQ32_009921 [Trebouxia sp. C0010 RCD-2024]
MADQNRRKQLASLLAAFQSPGHAIPIPELAEYLRLLRDLRIRDSDNVVTYGGHNLQQLAAALPEEELWLVYEQVAIAALDSRAMALATSLIQKIRKKFPKSSRTHRLTSMYLEACGETAKLTEFHKQILEDDENNEAILKRQVAVEKSKGSVSSAIELLRKYLDTYMLDKAAWEELGALYLQASLYQQAAHCYEELLLHMPSSIAYYVQYADIMYTIGGTHAPGHRADVIANDYRTAQSYYAAAVRMSEGHNIRALYGLCASASQLSGLKGRNAQSKDAADVADLAAQTLIRRYQEECESLLPHVRELIQDHSLSAASSSQNSLAILPAASTSKNSLATSPAPQTTALV